MHAFKQGPSTDSTSGQQKNSSQRIRWLLFLSSVS